MANEDGAEDSVEESVDYSAWSDEELVDAGWTAAQVVALRTGVSESELEPAEEAEEEAEAQEEGRFATQERFTADCRFRRNSAALAPDRVSTPLCEPLL